MQMIPRYGVVVKQGKVRVKQKGDHVFWLCVFGQRNLCQPSESSCNSQRPAATVSQGYSQFLKAGLHDHIQVTFASHILCGRVFGQNVIV